MVASELGTARAHAITKEWARPRQARDSTVGEAKQWESGSSMAFWRAGGSHWPGRYPPAVGTDKLSG